MFGNGVQIGMAVILTQLLRQTLKDPLQGLIKYVVVEISPFQQSIAVFRLETN